MRKLQSAALLLLIAGAARAAGPPPVITGVYPSPLVSIARDSMYALQITGRNFWPSGPNDPNRRVLQARRQGQPFRTVGIESMNNTTLNVAFPSNPLVSAPGTLEFMVKIDGMTSNIFAAKVVADPPRLDSLLPARITVGAPADDPSWKLWMRGSRWISPTTIWINGKNVGECYQNLNSGQEQFTWPLALRSIGTYTLLLRTEHGASEPKTVEIVPHATPTPPMAIKKDPLMGPAGTILKPTSTPTPGFVRVVKP